MKHPVIFTFLVTAIAIPVFAILAIAHATVWKRMGRKHATGLAWTFTALWAIAVLANPLLNHFILFPLYGNGVNRMLNDLKREHFVGKSRTELVARFGDPSIRMVNPGLDEDLVFACHPWFYWSYPEGVCGNVAQGKVVSFAYYH